MEHVDPMSLKKTDGVRVFKDLVEKAYEPIEEFRIGKIMDDFLFRFYRRNDQDIAVFNQAFDSDMRRIVEAAGELNPRWTTHLWFTKSGLTYDQRTKLLTATLGRFDLDALELQATRIFPDSRSLSSGTGKKGGSPTNKHSTASKRQKRRWKR